MGILNGFRQQILPFKRSFGDLALPPRFVRVERSCSVKVCGAGLNIPGSTQGLSLLQSPICTALETPPWGRAKVCAMVCLSQVSQVGEG